MKINVGSKNPTKIEGVSNIVYSSKLLAGSVVYGLDAHVEEFGHPKTLEETIEGARKRALAVFKGADLSVGLEGGMLASENAKSGYFETTACAIYDGTNFYIGLGPCFEWPAGMVKLILDGQDGSQAFKTLGLTQHEKIGNVEGAIHVLTHGKINRVRLNELAFTMALIQLENLKHY